MKTAIAAVVISSFSLVVAIISCVIAAKNYKKSKRLEFFQRRDQLFQKIAELNAKNSEAHLISARYDIVQLHRESLRLDVELGEGNKALQKLREDIRLLVNRSDEEIKQLHSICSGLTETDATKIETLIAMVQAASDDAKTYA